MKPLKNKGLLLKSVYFQQILFVKDFNITTGNRLWVIGNGARDRG
jgi:hypothetical protein